MRKILILAGSVAFIAFLILAQVAAKKAFLTHNAAGTTLGDSDSYIGVYGATPVPRPSGTNEAALTNTSAAVVLTQLKVTNTPTLVTLSLCTLTQVYVPGTNFSELATNIVVTNVTVNVVYGQPNANNTVNVTNVAVNAVAGYTTTNQADNVVVLLDAIRAALVTLGWIKGGA